MVKRRAFPTAWRPLYMVTVPTAREWLAKNDIRDPRYGENGLRITTLVAIDVNARGGARTLESDPHRLTVYTDNGLIVDVEGVG
jgi:hypothetical protein